MSTHLVRPRFEIEFVSGPDEVMAGIRGRLPDCPPCTGMSVGRHAELFVPESEQRLYSPWLSVTAHEHDGGTTLTGRFAPHPNIWTLYLFCSSGSASPFWSARPGATPSGRPKRLRGLCWRSPQSSFQGSRSTSPGQLGQRLGAEQMERPRHATH